jgi:hypothetical protein
MIPRDMERVVMYIHTFLEFGGAGDPSRGD